MRGRGRARARARARARGRATGRGRGRISPATSMTSAAVLAALVAAPRSVMPSSSAS